MTNQLNFSAHKTILNSGKLWLFCKVLLGTLLICTLLSSLNLTASSVLIFNFFIGVVLIGLIVIIKLSANQNNFIEITDNRLQYFCPVKKETVTIAQNEIIEVRSHFCELEIHTKSRIYFLNLKHIKQEKQRWEVKEMIKALVQQNEKQAVNF